MAVIDRRQFDAVLQQLVATRPGSEEAHEMLRQLAHISTEVLFDAEQGTRCTDC